MQKRLRLSPSSCIIGLKKRERGGKISVSLDKLKRIAASATAAAVLLLVILISVMIYQMASLNRQNRRKAELEQEIIQLQKEKEQTTDSIELWLCDWKIRERALKLGYKDADSSDGSK